MNFLDSVLSEIRQRGEQNREAIKTHRDVQAGKRGILSASLNSGDHPRKSEMRGIVGPKRKVVHYSEPPPLPRMRFEGEPLKCSGPKASGGDGYKRDRITGVITRCK